MNAVFGRKINKTKTGFAALALAFIFIAGMFFAFGALSAFSGGESFATTYTSSNNNANDTQITVTRDEQLGLVDSYRENPSFDASTIGNQSAMTGGGYANTGYSVQTSTSSSAQSVTYTDQAHIRDTFNLSSDLQTAINNDRVTSITMTVYYALYATTQGRAAAQNYNELYFHVYNSDGASVVLHDNSAVDVNGCLYTSGRSQAQGGSNTVLTASLPVQAIINLPVAKLKNKTSIIILASALAYANQTTRSRTTTAGAAVSLYDTQFSITYNTPAVGVASTAGGIVTGGDLTQANANATATQVQAQAPSINAIAQPNNNYYFTGWTGLITSSALNVSQTADQKYFQMSGSSFAATANFAQIPVTVSSTNTYVYNAAGQGAEITVSALTGGASVASWIYESTDGGGYYSTEKPTNIGRYKYSAILKNGVEDNVGVLTGVEFTIEKRTLYASNITGLWATNKEYDGTNVIETGGSFTGLPGDDNNKIVVGAEPLSGVDAGTYTVKFLLLGDTIKNYSYESFIVIDGSVTIFPKEIEFTLNVNNRIYDGTTRARAGIEFEVTGFSGLVDGENITEKLYSIGIATGYADKNAGSKTLTIVVNLIAGASDGGTKADNYELITNIYEATHEISPIELTLNNVEAQSKFYDGTDIITLTGSVSGIIAGEEALAYLVKAVRVASANASDFAYAVAVELGGEGAANYVMDNTPREAYIYKRNVAVTMTNAASKLYDGTDAAVLGVNYRLSFVDTVGVFAEGVQFSVDAAYGTANVGSGYSITANITLLDDNAINYTLSSYVLVSASTLRIDRALLTVDKKIGAIFEKIYDGTDAAKVLINGVYVDLAPNNLTEVFDIAGIVSADSLDGVLALNAARPSVYLSGKNAGEGLTVSVALVLINQNYRLVGNGAYEFDGSLIAKARAAQPEDIELEYGQALPTSFVLDGIPGETVTGSTLFWGALVGKTYAEYKDSGSYIVRFTPDDPNYTYVNYEINVTIHKKLITVVLPNAPIYKTYDGTNETPLGWLSYCSVEGLVLGDKITDLIDGLKFEFPGVNAGANGVILEFKLTDADGNYAFDLELDTIEYSETLDGGINAIKLTIEAPSAEAVYDGTDLSGLIKGQSFVYAGGLLDGEEGYVTSEDIAIDYVYYIDVSGNTVRVDDAAAFEAVMAYVYYYVPTLSYLGEGMQNYYVDTAAVLTVTKAAAEFGVTRTSGKLTVDNPKGYTAEYSIDGGDTWQSAAEFEVGNFTVYSVQIRLVGDDYVNYEPVQPIESEEYTSIFVPIGATGGVASVGVGIAVAHAVKLKKTAKGIKAASKAVRERLIAAEKNRVLNRSQTVMRLSDDGVGVGTQVVQKQARKIYPTNRY